MCEVVEPGAVRKPQDLIRSRSLQLLALAGGLLLFGPTMGIVGVAVAVNLALVVGLSVMIRSARPYVDFSLIRLLGVPSLGLLTGIGLTWILASLSWFTLETWQTGLVKAVVFSTSYCGLVGALEYRKLLEMAGYLKKHCRRWPQKQASKQDGEV